MRTHHCPPRLLRTRAVGAFVVVALTGLFAFVLAYLWTDETIAGSPYAEADPVGAAGVGAVLGASARFSEGMPAAVALVFVPVLVAGTGYLIAETSSLRRQAAPGPVAECATTPARQRRPAQ